VTSFISNIELSSLSPDSLSSFIVDRGILAGQSFSFNVGQRAFVFVNDDLTGFSETNDLLVEITGYSGTLSDQIFA
jgi:hypothetical protein